MCGICGLVSREQIGQKSIAQLGAMKHSLAHRGPDGEGTYSATHAALAMRRLSIIDLEGGWQPLYSEDRSLVLIANGEIYNFIELRKQLETKGHRFNTGSDCETILHLYEEHGVDCVQHLRGMFAFALWDVKLERLLLVRDRMGEKPLYVFERDGQLLFASELKALLASGLVPFELDPEAIHLFFHYQYVPEPMTPVKGVRKLDAAHLLTVSINPWKIEERCYWRMEDAPPLEGEPGKLLRESLEEAADFVVRSDVPVGVALSGGLDSSAVAALVARRHPGKLQAFSVGYKGQPESDERAEAKALAGYLQIPFHDVEIEVEAVTDFFPELNYRRDDPIADISGYGYYAVMKLAREHGVPVMLQGQGGDELFWGYPSLQQSALESLQKQASQTQSLDGLTHYLSFNAPSDLSREGVSVWARNLGGLRSGWQLFKKHRTGPQNQMVFYDLSPDFRIALNEAKGLYSKHFIEQLNGSNPADSFTFEQPWPRVDLALTRLICSTYLRENGITQGDRLSMASSVEMRLLLLDYKLVETIIGLRKAQTDVRLTAKARLKEALRDILPDWVMNRPKRGFAPPVKVWHDALFAAYGDSLRDGYLVQSKILSEESSSHLARGPFPAGAVSPLSFKALVLEQWCRQMLQRQPAAVS